MPDILEVIRKTQDQLSRREALVAKIVLDQPENVLNGSVIDLAATADVSQPTVIRFCRSVGCGGFRDFKLSLAQAMVRKRTFLNANVTREDSTQILIHKVVDASVHSVSQLTDRLDEHVMDQAIQALSAAKRIVFFGMGGSGAVAQDARHKFLRFDTPCEVYTDPIMLRMAVAGRGDDSAVVLISTTGRTADVLDAARIAGMSGFMVLTVTEPDTPLSRAADVAIQVDSDEDADVLIPMATRLAQLTVVDILATGVALSRDDEFKLHQARIKSIIRGTRLPAKKLR